MTREEAIKEIKSWDFLEGKEIEAIQTLIPELAESEDERIMSRIIDGFKNFSRSASKWNNIPIEEVIAYLEKQKDYVSNNFDDVWDEEDCEEIIAEGQKLTPRFKELLKEVCHAWYDRGAKLEKQKEQKHPNGCFTCDEYKKGYEEGRRNGFTAGYNKAMKEVEQKEQKPAEWSEEDEERLKAICTYLQDYPRLAKINDVKRFNEYCDWLKSLPLNLKKKNEDVAKLCSNEWSEEDKAHRDFILESLENQIRFCKKDAKGAYYTKQIRTAQNWLKSLPKRFVFQPKQEWSEDDEDFINMLILHFNYLIEKGGDSVETYKSYIEKLKSLRPSWEPSEQEKGALRTAIYVLTEERNFPKTAANLQAILDAFDGEKSCKEWKPSEEQMDALKHLVEYVAPSEKFIVIIKNLYDDLKKLM